MKKLANLADIYKFYTTNDLLSKVDGLLCTFPIRTGGGNGVENFRLVCLLSF